MAPFNSWFGPKNENEISLTWSAINYMPDTRVDIDGMSTRAAREPNAKNSWECKPSKWALCNWRGSIRGLRSIRRWKVDGPQPPAKCRTYSAMSLEPDGFAHWAKTNKPYWDDEEVERMHFCKQKPLSGALTRRLIWLQSKYVATE